jgi:tRNA(Ile)-lysidine synthase
VTLATEHLAELLDPWRGAACWWLGLSGGLDSCALLQLLVELGRRDELPPLAAIHIDHQLHPESSHWAAHCADLCERLGVPLECRQVVVEDTGEGPEAAARVARYGVFESILGPGELLLLAHHLDDQVETFFLRLMRGAGTRGLTGMPESRPLGAGALLRPLLSVPRSELEAYATDRQLAWIEDSSNSDLAMDRNFLRQRVLPLLEERWPGYRLSVERSVEALTDAERVLGEMDRGRLTGARREAFGEPLLDLETLAPVSEQELARLLRRWLEVEGVTAPRQSRLVEFSRQSLTAQEDSQPLLAGPGFCLRRYLGNIHLGAGEPQLLPESLELVPGQSIALGGVGQLEMVAAEEGLRLPESGSWQLRFRRGGERCRPRGRARSQSLKKLLQESRVPPWVREHLPLVYEGDRLAAVADLWVCEEIRQPSIEGIRPFCYPDVPSFAVPCKAPNPPYSRLNNWLNWRAGESTAPASKREFLLRDRHWAPGSAMAWMERV